MKMHLVNAITIIYSLLRSELTSVPQKWLNQCFEEEIFCILIQWYLRMCFYVEKVGQDTVQTPRLAKSHGISGFLGETPQMIDSLSLSLSLCILLTLDLHALYNNRVPFRHFSPLSNLFFEIYNLLSLFFFWLEFDETQASVFIWIFTSDFLLGKMQRIPRVRKII